LTRRKFGRMKGNSVFGVSNRSPCLRRCLTLGLVWPDGYSEPAHNPRGHVRRAWCRLRRRQIFGTDWAQPDSCYTFRPHLLKKLSRIIKKVSPSRIGIGIGGLFLSCQAVVPRLRRPAPGGHLRSCFWSNFGYRSCYAREALPISAGMHVICSMGDFATIEFCRKCAPYRRLFLLLMRTSSRNEWSRMVRPDV